MRLLAVSLCSWLSICLFNAGHRIPEALFFTVWEGGRPGPTREDWHVSWPGSVYARSWTSRRDAGRGIPQLQVLRAWACQILITFVHHSAFVVVYIWWSYCAICYLYSVFSDEKLAACSWITDQLILSCQFRPDESVALVFHRVAWRIGRKNWKMVSLVQG